MKEKGVIFDMDGVLVDSEKVWQALEREELARFGIDYTDEMIAKCMGRTAVGVWTMIRDDYHVDLDPVEMADRMAAAYLVRMSNPETAAPAMDGVAEVLAWLKDEGYALAVASSSNRDAIAAVTGVHDLTRYFDELVSGQDVAHGKPAPDIFLEAARRLGLSPERCLVVEDSAAGIAAAGTGGMTSLAYASAPAGMVDYSRADLVMNHFNQMPDLIRRWEGLK